MAALLLDDRAVTRSTHLVTFSTHRRRFVLRGDGRDVAARALSRLPDRCPGVAIDCAVFLPDRVYAIVRLPTIAALPLLVQTYKAETTRALKKRIGVDRVWEKGYEHRVIADEAELISIRAMLRVTTINAETAEST